MGMTAEELAALNEQIAGMAQAGLPLDQGLTALSKEMGRGRLKKVTAALGQDLRNGETLPAALEKRQSELPPYYAGLATAGIRSGQLPEVLYTLTRYARNIASTRAIVVDSIVYPLIVILFAVCTFFFLCLVVVPLVSDVLVEFRIPLPLPTRWVVQLSRQPLHLVLIPIVVMIVALVIAYYFMTRSLSGRRIWTRIIYATPLIGTMVRSSRLAAFVDLLSVLVKYQVPLPEAMQLAGDASSDPFLAEQARDVRTRLEHGATLGEALTARHLLPNWLAWMAKSGDQRNDLAPTLEQVGVVYRKHVEARAGVLRQTLPSIIIIFTAGVLTTGFLITVALPFVNLLEGLAK